MTDFSQFKVPIHPGINDTPKVATETEPGNGSDLIARFNALCDFLTNNLHPVATNGDYGFLNNIPPTTLDIRVDGSNYHVEQIEFIGNGIGYSDYSGGVLTISVPPDTTSGGGY